MLTSRELVVQSISAQLGEVDDATTRGSDSKCQSQGNHQDNCRQGECYKQTASRGITRSVMVIPRLRTINKQTLSS